MPDFLELDGRTFVTAEQAPIPLWACTTTEKPLPTLTLKDDDLFLIADTLGNISGCLDDSTNASLGLFCRDTRFLSRLELQIEGRSPILLSSDARKGFVLSALCANPKLSDRIKAETISIQREIVLNGGLFEELTITNYSTQPVQFELTLSFEADFVDLFEVRGVVRANRGRLLRLVPDEKKQERIDIDTLGHGSLSAELLDSAAQPSTELTMAYQGLDNILMESRVQFYHHLPDALNGYTAIWHLELNSHETRLLGYRLQPFINGRPASKVSAPITLMQAKAAELMEEKEWGASTARIRTNNRVFNQVIERAEQDIYLLRQTFGKEKALSAGVPWFSTLFGRDALITASQTLILDPTIARETLTILAHYQGEADNEWREEEPGKILHELRLGEMARCQEVPHTPYYGTVDATPLWLMLYAEYYAWTQDQETLDKLWDAALAAMDWIDRNCRETGYLSYLRRSKGGLHNQGWKDSDDCIVNYKGELATGPIALCEVQAYVYAAKIRLSEIAQIKKRIDLAERWQEEARDLKIRFNRDFWLNDQDYCAIALDGNGKPVDSITSNPGQCLSLGIFQPEKARSVAERLQAPDMFNGWG
ncbi:MAG TPA: glycogen debranching N-terminal domain-containing protein, partial [Chroococcidiopsis sp.]